MQTAAMTIDGQPMACLEVWGGNEGVDTALVVPGLEVWVYAAPFNHAAAGGDVHFVSSCGTGRIARLMVADVAGHGEEVAETGRLLRGLIRRYMNHIDQRQFIMGMNRRFTEMKHAGRFATAVAMTFFSPTCELNVCNAGHPLPLIYRQRTQRWEFLGADESPASDDSQPASNLPLGIVGDADYEQLQVELDAGDMVLCYTDSLMEAVQADGKLLGTHGLLELVRTLPVDQPGRLIHALLLRLSESGATLNDDVTALLSRCRGKSGGAGLFRRLGAQVKFIAEMMTFRRNIPWPEWSWKNLGGAVFGKRS